MGKKKRKAKKKRPSQPILKNLTIKDLEIQGSLFLGSNKYKEAIPFFKELVSREDIEKWRNLLAKSYSKRAQELAEKGFIIEALVMLDNMKIRCRVDCDIFFKLQLLFKKQKYKEAIEIFSSLKKSLSREQQKRIESLLGAYCLAKESKVIKEIKANNPNSNLILHLPVVRDALAAYCSGNFTEARKRLKPIPFNSPYREFRTLLNGLLEVDSSKGEQNQFLARIPSDSPYASIARMYGINISSIENLFHDLQNCKTNASKKTLLMPLNLKQNIITILLSLSEQPCSAMTMFKAVNNHCKYLPGEKRLFILKRLITQTGKDAPQVLANMAEVTPEEAYIILALAAENFGSMIQAVYIWDDVLSCINLNKPENHLKAALIYQKQAEMMQYLSMEFDLETILATLNKSLKLDPLDKITWIKAIEISGKIQESIQYKLINNALKKLPEEIDILIIGVKAAIKRGAYKKASTLSSRVLKIDPINSEIKKQMVEARLAHGRKLVGQGKIHLAIKEFEQALGPQHSERLYGRNFICLGMLNLLEKDNSKAEELIKKGQDLVKQILIAKLLTSMEARLLNIPLKFRKKYDKELRKACGAENDKDLLLLWVNWDTNLQGKELKALEDCFPIIKKIFTKAYKLNWSKDEALLLIRSLFMYDFFQPILKIANKILKKWPGHPELVFFSIWASSKNGEKKLCNEEIRRLEKAADQADSSGNFLLREDIEDLLYLDGIYNEDEYDDAVEEVFEEFFSHIKPSNYEPNIITLTQKDENIVEKPEKEQENPALIQQKESSKNNANKGKKEEAKQLSLWDLL
jgi:cellulose synthase operon protein C